MAANPFKQPGVRRFGYYFLQGYNSHSYFCKWVKNHRSNISSALEIGCGYFEYYSYFFQSLGIEYSWLDLMPEVIEFRKSINPEQTFICKDFLNYPSYKKYDLVFSHMLFTGILEEETCLRMLELKVGISNRYGFVVIWSAQEIILDNYFLCLSRLDCKNINIFKEPTNLSDGEPQEQTIISWEK